jgi:Kef-type K+ transport system membrane component KefB
MHGSATLLTDIALGIIFASAAAHVVRLFKQPLILGYILGGVLLGSHFGFSLVTDEASIELISEIGLILLLFIIGLEINLRDLMKMGKSMFILGFAQFAICVGLGMVALKAFGFGMGGGNFDLLYLSVAASLSSTLIVVKLLHDKFEINTVAGRLTVGVLVLQDIWAILFMAFQPNLLDPQLASVVKSLGLGVVVVLLAFSASKYVLSRLFAAAGRTPELVLLTSVAWCFAVGGFADEIGLSKEMGALIAGMSIAAFPYGPDVIAKLAGVRDFFVTLFFVALGLKVPKPTWDLAFSALGLTGFVIVSRLISVVPVCFALRKGLRTGSVAALNLAQISEFSLVILALGVGYGHVSEGMSPLLLSSLILASVLATYIIQFNDLLARLLVRAMALVGVREKAAGGNAEAAAEGHGKADVVLLGNYLIGQSFLDFVHAKAPALKKRILVADFNTTGGEKLKHKGFRWVYADLAHPETLHHFGLEHARMVICSLSDTFLKGITNRQLLRHLQKLAPEAKYVMTAEDDHEADVLRREGAFDVIVSGRLSGAYLFELASRR